MVYMSFLNQSLTRDGRIISSNWFKHASGDEVGFLDAQEYRNKNGYLNKSKNKNE
jgi:hypothetical protein